MTPGHVLMTADAVGGVWTYALDLSEALVGRGVKVTLVVLGPEPDAAQREAAEALPGRSMVMAGLPLDWLADATDALDHAAQTIRGLAREGRADLVHLNSPALRDAALWEVPVIGACHSCLATWWEAVRSGPMPDDFGWRTRRLAQGYSRCDALIAPSRAFAQQTAVRYGVQPTTVRNGRRPRPATFSSRERTVLAAGRLWDEGKNLSLLDRAARRMRGRVEAAGPVVGPAGQVASPINHIALLGALKPADLDQRMRAAAIFCSPALYEPFGLGVLEGAQAGCALVLADIPTFRELWDGAALFVDPRDDRALASTLDALLDDDDRLRRLSEDAVKRAAAFSNEAMATGTLAVYAEVLNRRGAAAEAAA